MLAYKSLSNSLRIVDAFKRQMRQQQNKALAECKSEEIGGVLNWLSAQLWSKVTSVIVSPVQLGSHIKKLQMLLANLTF